MEKLRAQDKAQAIPILATPAEAPQSEKGAEEQPQESGSSSNEKDGSDVAEYEEGDKSMMMIRPTSRELHYQVSVPSA
ncbi:hypothetical protein HAX54_030823 [Datura stramonium]|uniref:Uncharacterized protein n=1 Tax=Datura stramonium TaxID=4076 RepID=A0ABS8VBC0_DATST|nr:hypothetical protein [Datura stramonium]